MLRPLTFEDLRTANVQRDKEWNPDDRLGALFWSTELAGELGEACNKVKKLERERLGLPGKRTTWLELAAELGDVQICLDLLAMHYSIDLAEAARKAFNDKSVEMKFFTRL